MPSDSTKDPTRHRPTPAELRSMLGANLRQLSRQAPSISALCRELGINRTQYNRYLAGESFPRPDVLHRICSYFGVDARILLEPVENIAASADSGILTHPAVRDFVGNASRNLSEEVFPSGFFRFVRRSFLEEDRFVQGLVYVFRDDGHTFVKGFESRQAMRSQGLPMDKKTREFRGVMLPQEDGLAGLVSSRGGATASFNYLARIPSFENNFWLGYVTRTVRENVAGSRVERLVYEYLGRDTHKVLQAAREAGFCPADNLPTFQKTLLKVDKPFS